METEACFLQTRNGRHRKATMPRSPMGSCFISGVIVKESVFPSVYLVCADTMGLAPCEALHRYNQV